MSIHMSLAYTFDPFFLAILQKRKEESVKHVRAAKKISTEPVHEQPASYKRWSGKSMTNNLVYLMIHVDD